MRMLERIKATLYDAEERNIRDKSVKLWLKELRGVAHEAEYVLDEYMYEVYRAQVEARNASELNPVKGNPEQSVIYYVQIPCGIVDRIKDIKSRFEEIAKDREALCLREEDAPRRHCNERKHIPTSPLVVENSIFGREVDKEKVIDLLLSDYNQGKSISVLPIVGKGGIGKTTLARLVYNDKQVQGNFDMSAWVCVSDDFNIARITQYMIESFTRTGCDLKNPSVLLEKIVEKKRVFVVLDDVWNEEQNRWELLLTPLMKATTATILVTTRNLSVARIMQTMDPLQLAYLSDDRCWLLFRHYAFQGIDPALQSNLLEIGKKIVKKCGGLPLAVKSIASLLKHEAKEQSWMEILQSDIWELSAGNEILAPLQISYERLPIYLKPCLLLCSMFPKDYDYDVKLMTSLWIAHGYIEPKGKKDLEGVAADYAKEMYERSFFDYFKIRYRQLHYTKEEFLLNTTKCQINDFIYRNGNFRLHDMVHDLAWLNSDRTCYSVDRGISKEICHLYLDEKSDFDGFRNISVLQTVVIKNHINLISLLKIDQLRALELEGIEVQSFPIVGHLKHLFSLSLRGDCVKISQQFIYSSYSLQILTLDFNYYHELVDLEGIGNLINLEILELNAYYSHIKLPESLGYLSKLRVLEIHESLLSELPECIGNLSGLHRIVLTRTELKKLPESFCMLTNLKDLILIRCNELKELPEDFGKLTSLEFLLLQCPSIHYLPLSCTKLVATCTMNVCNLRAKPERSYGALGWLKDFNDLRGYLGIKDIHNISRLEDARNANLVSKHNLETLLLDWNDIFHYGHSEEDSLDMNMLDISILYSKNHKSQEAQNPFRILEIFQPHSNLKHLYVGSYHGLEFPQWVADPFSCASLVKLCIKGCSLIKFLPLGNMFSLKQLDINYCEELLHLKRESLPSELEHLTISHCNSLVEVSLMGSLIKLHVHRCIGLKLLSTAYRQQPQLKGSSSLKQMTVQFCPLVDANQLILGEDCDVHIEGCRSLKDWCLQHDFTYQNSKLNHSSYPSSPHPYKLTSTQIRPLLQRTPHPPVVPSKSSNHLHGASHKTSTLHAASNDAPKNSSLPHLETPSSHPYVS